MTIVADASPLILLARVCRLELLRMLYGQVIIPPVVAAEAFRDVPGRPGAVEIAQVAGTWLLEAQPSDVHAVAELTSEVDSGEAQAIALASELRLLLLIDDLAGRRAAQARAIHITGTGGILVAAKRRGLIMQVAPILDALLAQGLRLTTQIQRQLLEEAGGSVTGRPVT